MATTIPILRQNDSGTIFEVLIKEDGLPADFSTYTALAMRMEKPSGTVVEVVVVPTTDGSDGLVRYTFTNELDEVGHWRFQIVVTTPAGKWTTSPEEFYVAEAF